MLYRPTGAVPEVVVKGPAVRRPGKDHVPEPNAQIRELDDLLAVFYEAEKPREQWRIGSEAERFGVDETTGDPLPYGGSRGVDTIFERLAEQHGWEKQSETEAGPVIALRRGGSSVTLEPGAQMELSGAPFRTVREGRDEWAAHMKELAPIVEELGWVWLGLGHQPFATREELGWVPKLRYGVMRKYLPTRGSMALDMMLRTSTVQANLDYASEDDAMRKLRVGLRAQPLVTAMFANSPWRERKDSGYRSSRALVWMNMDPDRSGLLPFAWKDQPRYRDYVEWALDAPMFLFRRGTEVIHNTGQTFRSFMTDGFGKHRAIWSDWLVHLGTLFPEVRLKTTLEYRGADAQGPELLFALPALWRGLLYDEESLGRLEGLTDPWPYLEVERSRESLARRGVRTRFMGRDAVDWAGEILELAEAGLQRLTADEEQGEAERQLLKPLRSLLEQALCPADLLLARMRANAPFEQEVIRLTAL